MPKLALLHRFILGHLSLSHTARKSWAFLVGQCNRAVRTWSCFTHRYLHFQDFFWEILAHGEIKPSPSPSSSPSGSLHVQYTSARLTHWSKYRWEFLLYHIWVKETESKTAGEVLQKWCVCSSEGTFCRLTWSCRLFPIFTSLFIFLDSSGAILRN